MVSAPDVVQIDRIAQAWQGKHPAQVGRKTGVIGKLPQIALEQAMIGGIKAHQRDEGADIGFGKPCASLRAIRVRLAQGQMRPT